MKLHDYNLCNWGVLGSVRCGAVPAVCSPSTIIISWTSGHLTNASVIRFMNIEYFFHINEYRNLHSEYITKESLKGFGDFKIGGQIIRTVKRADDIALFCKKRYCRAQLIDELKLEDVVARK